MQMIKASLIACASAVMMAVAPATFAAGMAHGSHQAMPCTQCHKTTPMAAPSQKDCLACHGNYAKLAKATESMTPNPHDSHMGRVDCTECHGMHKPSHFMCRDCHAFKNVKFKGE